MKKNIKMPYKACSFKDIEKYLKKTGQDGKDVLDALECLTDAAIIFCPVFLGPQYLVLLNILDEKDRLFRMINKVYDCLIKTAEPNYLTRIEQIRVAYAYIAVTAYLEVLPDAFPKKIIKKLKQEIPNINDLIKDPIETSIGLKDIQIDTEYYVDHITTFTEVKNSMVERYREAGEYLIELINRVFVNVDEIEEKELEAVKLNIRDLPQKAIKNYEAQYIMLADKFNDFALFAEHQLLKGIDYSLCKNNELLEKYISLQPEYDIGFKNINEFVNSFATTFKAIKVQDIVDDLKRSYSAMIKKPIISEKEIDSDVEIKLFFPSIVDAYIPQSYKCLSYASAKIKLEDESLWDGLDVHNDLEEFFIRYLNSPDTIDYPLVILGQPGSGKSLLTKVLSAQFMSESYTVIRIPLRDVNANDEINTVIEEQIQKDINRPLSDIGFGGFASEFMERPLTIIFDGYDELLQAKGEVCSGYLDKIRLFQQQQKELNRPIRTIITSRITLIDKAHIPLGSTILRLMEFDPDRQNRWISIWNETNKEYFDKAKINPFRLPAEDEGNNNILELSKQPLLLLMLAIFDSESNELAQNRELQRTELYDKLIRRFVRRERSRYVQGFEYKSQEEQAKIIDEEMNRLGIVAIGMYNRKEVVIHSEQLEADLKAFKALRECGSAQIRTLKESESILGSFFFIHQSVARDLDVNSEKVDSAYEFLHNTFGEFLAADFILRNTTNTVVNVFRNRYSDINLETLIKSDWLYCLMLVPLYSRPVIIEMIREHLERALHNNYLRNSLNEKISLKDYIDTLNSIVENQLSMVLNKRRMPESMYEENLFDSQMSLLGYLSTYSINLVILISCLSPDGYRLIEKNYCQSGNCHSDNGPWNELVSLWKVEFSQNELMGLSAVLRAKRLPNGEMLIKCNDKFEAFCYTQPMDVLLCVSYALGDSFMSGLSGSHSQEFEKITQLDAVEASNICITVNSDVYFSYLIKRIRSNMSEIQSIEDVINKFALVENTNMLITKILDAGERLTTAESDVLFMIFEALEYCLLSKVVYVSIRNRIVVFLRNVSCNYFGLTRGSSDVNCFFSLSDWSADQSRIDFHSRYIGEMIRLDFSTKNKSKYGFSRMYTGYHYDNYGEDINLLSNIDKLYLNKILANVTSSKEKRKTVEELLNATTIRCLVLTNPELLFCILKELLRKRNILTTSGINAVLMIASRCISCLDNVDINRFRLDTLLNTLIIAKEIKADEYINRVVSVLSDDLSVQNDCVMRMVFFNPALVNILLNIVPDLVDFSAQGNFKLYLEKESYVDYYLISVDPAGLIEYLSVVYYIPEEIGYEQTYFHQIVKEILYRIASHIYGRINISTLSVEQLEILKKCSERIGYAELLHAIKQLREK